ncbi:MAG: hypothetical protein QXJ19_04275 [Candidatus Bathyarchaeia archaeon]|nr:hypothetical protein [Candidatus Bathyarchaeota archaeon]
MLVEKRSLRKFYGSAPKGGLKKAKTMPKIAIAANIMPIVARLRPV